MSLEVSFKETSHFESPLFIDVRSPGEFAEYTIPGAINMPILNNKEREQVGKTYVQTNHDQAKLLGVKFASQRLPRLVEKYMSLAKHHQVILFCSRGGYRSSILFELLNALHVHVFKLEGGYKAFRKLVNQELPNLVQGLTWINLNGMTGVGKTEILSSLKAQGSQIVDLEGLANHRGSNLGQVGLGAQPSQKQFEADLYQVLLGLDPRRPVYIEAESHRVGERQVPHELFLAYQNSDQQVLVTSPLSVRVARVENIYAPQHSQRELEELKAGLARLAHLLKPATYAHFLAELEAGNYGKLIEELITHYYDPHYKLKAGPYALTIDNTDAKESAETLQAYFEN